MQNNTADFNSMRAAVGRRLGVSALAIAACEQEASGLDQPSIPKAWPVQLPIEERPAPIVWRQTKKRRATRKIGVKSKRSFRISIVDVRAQEIRAESLIEAWLVLVLLASPDVVDVIEQPKFVVYVDDEGEPVKHWFDCVAVLKDGRRIAYVVKPKALAKRMGTRRLVELLAMQIDADVADMVMHVDEDCLSPVDVYNAELVNSVRLHGPWADDPVVSAMASVVDRPMLLDDAVARASHRGQGFRAIVRLIADGLLRVTPGFLIDYGSVIEPTPNQEVLH